VLVPELRNARLRENLSCADGSACRASALVQVEVNRDVFDLTALNS
jgi:hypothetical protein